MPSSAPVVASRERALAKLLPRNGLLAALPEDAQDRLLPHLGLVDLPAGQTLIEQDGTSVRAFFPVTGLVSLSRRFPDGSSSQVAVVGREGLLGLPVFIDGGLGFNKAVVRCAGYGLALGCEPLQEEWHRGGSFMRVLGRYAEALKSQVLQLSACHVDHSVEEQICRLLLSVGPAGHGEMNPPRAAALLGVTPEQVARAVDRLERAGAISVQPDGSLAVREPAVLHALACRCDRCARDECERAMAEADEESDQPRIRASISSGLTGTPREISSQPPSPTIASSSMRMPM